MNINWNIAVAVLFLIGGVRLAEADTFDLSDKRFVSDGICVMRDGQETYCIIYEDDATPNHFYLAVYNRERLIVVKKVSKTDFGDQVNVWKVVKDGI